MACLFCAIVAGEQPATIIHRDDLVTAFRDTKPQAPVHVLLIPNEHVASAAELDAEHGDILARLFSVANEVARQEGIALDGYRLVFNVGRAAGQSVDHLHLHLLGGRRLTWPPG
jgi:histidine triad (HIT) family protein